MIVGISGKLRSGKDTVAQMLLESIGYTVCERLALADVLKRECQNIYGLDLMRMYKDYDYKEEIRPILIKHGADRRAEDIDYWVKKVLENALKPITLVPDVRYRNEVDSLAKGADVSIMIRVESDYAERMLHGWNKSDADADPSECQLDDYDGWSLVIQNNGTLKDLRSSLAPAIQVMKDYLQKNSLLYPMAEIS